MQVETTTVRADFGMPDEILAALLAGEAQLGNTPRPSPVHGTTAQWADVVAAAQRVVNRAVAVQDEALVSLAAIEPELLDDGTVVESHRTPGHVALDAPAIASGALSVSAVHAEHRVRAAVRLAADGPSGTDTATGLRALHEAMAAGRLDSYRAGVLADELEQAPAEVAAAVVQALHGSLDHETGPQLRARCRRVLATISPDLLRQRAPRARESCRLRRWAQEPGVDQWEGTFPSEDAARAWAAIDARAHQLRADGTCPRIERARAQALIDLVTGSATITTVLTLTVPAEATNGDGDHMSPTGTAAADAAPAGARTAITDDGTAGGATHDRTAGGATHDRTAGSPTHDRTAGSPTNDRTAGSPTNDRTAGSATERVARPTGAHTTGLPSTTEARLPDAPTAGAPAPRSAGGATSAPAPDDLVEVTVSGIAQPVLVTRAFLHVVAKALQEPTATRACHPLSGALLGSAGSAAYRPPAAVAALVRQRDGRCRFPGCHVNARFCDLDHVRPWPAGRTEPTNLICLCRRHHRIKQRPGWTVRLAVDGQCSWTDPTGRVRTTQALDALHTLVLPAATRPSDSDPRTSRKIASGQVAQLGDLDDEVRDLNSEDGSRTMYDLRGRSDRHSGLEFALEHHAAAISTADLTRIAALRTACHPAIGHRTRLTLDVHHRHQHRPRAGRVVWTSAWPPVPGHRTSTHRRPDDNGSDDPPF